jgi:folate-binding protein YgfZ
MKSTLLTERGVVKVAGADAGRFLNGLMTNDIAKVKPQAAIFGALLTPQGKIVSDFIVAETPAEDGGGFFLDCPRALAGALVEKLKFYKLRAKVTIEDLSDALGVMAIWDGSGSSEYGLSYADPRLAGLGWRVMLPPQLYAEAAGDLGATPVDAEAYDAHRIALGVPRGGADFAYGDAYPHEADMDQLGGVDFGKGCYIGQEVVSRVEHRSTARSRVVPIGFDDFGPMPGLSVIMGDKYIGVVGSCIRGQGLALLRLDRVAEALGSATPLMAGGITIHVVKPAWANFAWPGEIPASESKAAS